MMRAFRLALVASLIAMVAVACSRDETVVSQDGRFSATFPSKPQTSAIPVQGDGFTLTMNMVAAEKASATYVVSYVDYPSGTLAQKSPDQAFQDIVDGTVGNVGGTLRSVTPVALGDATGRAVMIDVPAENVAVHERIYLVGDRLYQVMYGGPKGSEIEKGAMAFLDSFKLLR
jgi:hypothetical protein